MPSQATMEFLQWSVYVWPFIVSLGFLVLAKPRPVNRLAFFVLGVLVCFGVQSLVGLALAYTPGELEAGATAPERFFQAAMIHIARTVGVSAALSLVPLWWLRRYLPKA